jgi:hypothetical protein
MGDEVRSRYFLARQSLQQLSRSHSDNHSNSFQVARRQTLPYGIMEESRVIQPEKSGREISIAHLKMTAVDTPLTSSDCARQVRCPTAEV